MLQAAEVLQAAQRRQWRTSRLHGRQKTKQYGYQNSLIARNDKDGEQETLVGAGNNTQIRKAVEEINKRAHNSEAVFGIHDATNRVMIKIVDKDTKEVLKEYPPEKTLDMIAKVWEVAGLLVDEKM